MNHVSEDNTQPRMHSICIPRIPANISRSFIFNVFCNLKIGFISRILEIPIKTDVNFKRIIVYVKWADTPTANYFRSRFDEDKNVKVVYTMPWYWICVSNRYQKAVSYNQ